MHAPGLPGATAVLVERGVVAWIGDEDGADSLAASAGAVDDTLALDGALVTPGFVDAHVHLAATGLAVSSPDLSATRSAGQLLDAVAAHARTLPTGAVVLGLGWDDSTWENSTWQRPARLPTRAELAAAAGGRPVFLGRVDVHSALVSGGPPPAGSAAQVPVEALVAWEDRPGAVTLPGVLAGLLTRQARRDLLAAALTAAADAGIALLHEMAAPQLADVDDLALLDELGSLLRPADPDTGAPRPETGGPRPETGHPGPARPLVAAWWGQHAADGGLDVARAAGATGCGGDLCVDGSLGSRTAALLAPYRDGPGTGVLQLSAEAVAEHVVACSRAGTGTGFHLIGDRAATAVAQGLALAAERIGPAAVSATTPRLEHAEMIPPELVAPLAALGAVASVQPAFATTWGRPGGMYERRLGSRRVRGMNAFADLASAGMPIAVGSDAPVTPLAGWSAVRDAVGHPVPEQALGVRAAFAAATRGGWRAAGRPGAGRVVVGAPAHLALWDVAGGWDESVPDGRVARWSTDPASGVAALPALGGGRPLPVCRGLLVGGRPTAGPR